MRNFIWIAVALLLSPGCDNTAKVDRDGETVVESRAPNDPIQPAPPPAISKLPSSGMTDSKAGSVKILTRYIPADSAWVLAFKPDRLFESAAFQQIFKNVVAPFQIDPVAATKQTWGFEPADLDQMAIVSYRDAATFGAVILRFREPDTAAALYMTKIQPTFRYEKTHRGQKYHSWNEPRQIDGQGDRDSLDQCFCLVDDRTILFGFESMIVKMMTAENQRSRVIDTLRGMTFDHDAIWVSNGEVNGELFAGLFESRSMDSLLMQAIQGGDRKEYRDERLRRIPRSLWKFAEIVERNHSVLRMNLDFDPQLKVHAYLEVADEETANKAAAESRNVLRYLREALIANRQTVEVQLAPWAGQKELSAVVEKLKSPVTRTHLNSVSLNLDGSGELSSLAIASVTMFARNARTAARATECRSQLHDIVIGLHNYHEEFGHFPPAASKRTDGQLLLSWRVHLLPYLGEEELYKEFRLNEPWDSEHNQRLIMRIPKVFQLPGRLVDGKTHYLGLAGTGALFAHSTGARFRDVSDGSDETIAIVCVDDETAIAWTKPGDYRFDSKTPASGLGQQFGPGYQFVAVSGSVSQLDADIDPKTLHAMFTIDADDN